MPDKDDTELVRNYMRGLANKRWDKERKLPPEERRLKAQQRLLRVARQAKVRAKREKRGKK